MVIKCKLCKECRKLVEEAIEETTFTTKTGTAITPYNLKKKLGLHRPHKEGK